jgi:hypothetical protein
MTVEVKIPWKDLDTNMAKKVSLPPKNNEKMRINFYRIDRRDNVSTPDLYAWSPTMNGSFHTPAKFGYIVFSTTVPTSISPENNNLSSSTLQKSITMKAVDANPGTVHISFFVPLQSRVLLTVCTASGQVVRMLESTWRSAGYHETVWDCRDEQGHQVQNGVYSIFLQAGNLERACALPIIRK